MPYVKKRGTKPKPKSSKPYKKTSKGGAGRGVGIASYGVKSEPVPRVLYTKVKYADDQQFLCADSVAVAHKYSMNTIFSPNTAGGHTTVGHAQLAQLYGQYWVMGARINVEFFDPTADGLNVGCRLAINGNDDVTGEGLSQAKGKPMTYISALSNSGNQRKKFSFQVKPWSLVGVSKLEYMANSSAYSSFITSNPSTWENCVIQLFAIGPDDTNVRYQISIEYDTKLYARKAMEYSLI